MRSCSDITGDDDSSVYDMQDLAQAIEVLQMRRSVMSIFSFLLAWCYYVDMVSACQIIAFVLKCNFKINIYGIYP